jgi:hypothetical protein
MGSLDRVQTFDEPKAIATKYNNTKETADRARQRRLEKRKYLRFRNGAHETAMSRFGS